MDTSNLELQRQQFQRDGFLVLPGHFSADAIDRLCATVAETIEQRAGEIVVDNLRNRQRTFWADAQDRETRHFKFTDLYLLSPQVRDLVLEARLAPVLAALMAQPVVLCGTLNFQKGSSQPAHIDSLYMTPQTPHALLATWIALEDTHPDSGPLVYYPGSHRIPLFRFQDGSNHATPAEMPAWQAYIEAEVKARGIEAKTFLARKGDVFIWHSDLLHGGSPIKDDKRTRHSIVSHYYSEADCRKLGLKLVPLQGNFWAQRARHPLPVPPEKFDAKMPFPEAAYLERYPDVKGAVESGAFTSGFAHYAAFGFKEGRGI